MICTSRSNKKHVALLVTSPTRERRGPREGKMAGRFDTKTPCYPRPARCLPATKMLRRKATRGSRGWPKSALHSSTWHSRGSGTLIFLEVWACVFSLEGGPTNSSAFSTRCWHIQSTVLEPICSERPLSYKTTVKENGTHVIRVHRSHGHLQHHASAHTKTRRRQRSPRRWRVYS